MSPASRGATARVAVAPATRRPVAYLLAVALAVAGFLTAVPAGPAHASTAQLHTLLAQTRSAHRLPALQRSSSLDAVAQRWSQQMASTGKLAHNPNMTSQIPAGWTFAGENVGYAGSATQVHDAWLKSPGHRANILDSDYNAIGIGYVKVGTRIWATQVFARYQRVPNPVSTTSTSGSSSTGAVAVQSGTTGRRVSDLSGDKRADILARDSKGQLWVYPGTGRGSLAARKLAGNGWGPYTVVTPGDMNGDGRGDVYARDSAGRLWLYPGNGRSGLATRRLVGTGWNGYTIVTPGDFNGDGRNDLLARDSAGRMWLFAGTGKGGVAARKQIGSGWQAFNSIVGAGDLTGDGRVDVLARDRNGGLWLYRGNGRGGWAAAGQRIGSGWNSMTSISSTGDLTGDGRSDVVARDGSGRLWLYPGNGRGGFSARKQIGSGWQGMSQIA